MTKLSIFTHNFEDQKLKKEGSFHELRWNQNIILNVGCPDQLCRFTYLCNTIQYLFTAALYKKYMYIKPLGSSIKVVSLVVIIIFLNKL